MAGANYDVYQELDHTLDDIRGLLHGIRSSMEFYSDKEAELNMIAIAETLTEEALELAGSLEAEYRKAIEEPRGQSAAHKAPH